MSQRFHIRVAKDAFVFSAGHFITFNGDVCERLHGHNYKAAVEIEGPLDENGYVFDFIAVRDAVKGIVDALDHRMLLPTGHPLIQVTPVRTALGMDEVEVRFRERRWVFPACDCLLLPVANTTTELMARWFGLRLLDDLEARVGARPQVLRVEIDECYGQLAVCELRDE